MSEATYLVGDVFERMAELPDGSVDLIVTSPPFLALRSYLSADHEHKHLEIGSEPTPAAFLSTLLALTREWRRLLAPHGSLCVELGDTYSGSGGAGGDYSPGGLRDGQQRFDGSASKAYGTGAAPRPQRKRTRTPERDWAKSENNPSTRAPAAGWPLDKSLCLLPTLYPASLAYGRNLLDPDDQFDPWRIRNLIVWHRPNPPVGALGDKVRPSTSYVTVACTSRTRWFDLDAERTEHADPRELQRFNIPTPSIANPTRSIEGGDARGVQLHKGNPAGAPPLDCWFDTTTEDVWTIPTAPYKGSHYATFPPALPRKLINLMCPRQVCTICGEPRRRITGEAEYVPSATNRGGILKRDGERVADGANQWVGNGAEASVIRSAPTLGWSDCGHDTWRRGIVLDPFAGSGTTLAAASELGRDSIGIDLDERNLDLARQRCGMFLVEGPV